MKRFALLAILAAPLAACETLQLYEGDRDPFARMVEVMEPMDISPADRGAPPPLPIAQPLAPPATPALPAAPPPMPAMAAPQAPAAALPPPPPAPIAAQPPAPEPPATRRPLPAAARLAVAPKPGVASRLRLDNPPAKPAPAKRPQPQPAALPLPPPPSVPSPIAPPAPEPAVAAPKLPEPELPAAPAPPPPPIQLAEPSSETAAPTARERGRPLIARTNRVSEKAKGASAAFTSADGQMGSELGADIGGAARPVGQRSPQSTRKVISDAKGDLAECYVNEQLFQEDAKGTAVVVIEVPKELPNLPRIETSDFTETMNICLLEAVRNLPFPGDPDGMVYRLRVPFRFRPD